VVQEVGEALDAQGAERGRVARTDTGDLFDGREQREWRRSVGVSRRG
jgi:hypothetical protein